MNRSAIVRLISFIEVILLIVCILPAFGSFAEEPVIVREVNVTGVTEPVPGQHPVYNAETNSPYVVIDTDYSSEEVHCVNGMFWNEMKPDGSFVRTMTESDEFRNGYDYFFCVAIKTVGNAELGNYFTNLLDVSINNCRADFWNTADSTTITRIFQCSYVIDSFDLTISAPIAGGTPSYAAVDTVRYMSKDDSPALEGQLNGVIWKNIATDRIMKSNDVFDEYTYYMYQVSLYAKAGYSFASVLDVTVNGQEASYSVIGKKVDIYFIVTPVYGNPFNDVPDYQWYTDAVKWCNFKKFMTGTSDTTFSPKAPFTRAMFVTVLAKIDGADTSTYTGTSFDDVPTGKWYSAPVEWAFKNEYTTGTGNNRFSPDTPVTRETLAQFLYNYSVKKGKDVTVTEDLSRYTDAGSVSKWAVNAVKWAVENSLISGTSETTVSPKDTATRAQVALIIMKYFDNVIKEK